MKYTQLHLLRKITLICLICFLALNTMSCTNGQTNSVEAQPTETPIETTETSDKATNSTVNELPKEIKSAVLSDASKRIGKPVDGLRITKVEKQNWSDGCLGLAKPGEICTQAIVPGWQVVVSNEKNNLVYRTDEKGKQIKLEESIN